jgi:hypothetical protein
LIVVTYRRDNLFLHHSREGNVAEKADKVDLEGGYVSLEIFAGTSIDRLFAYR